METCLSRSNWRRPGGRRAHRQATAEAGGLALTFRFATYLAIGSNHGAVSDRDCYISVRRSPEPLSTPLYVKSLRSLTLVHVNESTARPNVDVVAERYVEALLSARL
jgi:UDP-N-acetylmuramyl pentapeptide phosphotransferase/UDP-N-acetylglucosamine-1-phosphate transferase